MNNTYGLIRNFLEHRMRSLQESLNSTISRLKTIDFLQPMELIALRDRLDAIFSINTGFWTVFKGYPSKINLGLILKIGQKVGEHEEIPFGIFAIIAISATGIRIEVVRRTLNHLHGDEQECFAPIELTFSELQTQKDASLQLVRKLLEAAIELDSELSSAA